jgi:hypothetical protein
MLSSLPISTIKGFKFSFYNQHIGNTFGVILPVNLAGMSHYLICLERSISFMLMVLYMLFLLMLYKAWSLLRITGKLFFVLSFIACSLDLQQTVVISQMTTTPFWNISVLLIFTECEVCILFLIIVDVKFASFCSLVQFPLFHILIIVNVKFASCFFLKKNSFRMFSNEDVTIGAWMLAMNVNHENIHELCSPECTSTSIAVWDIPKCSGLYFCCT